MSIDKKKNPNRSGSPLYWSAESWAFMSLRLFLAFRFLFAGFNKFKGADGYAFSNYYESTAPWIIGAFEKSVIPGFLVAPFAYMIAYVEIILGLLLLLGVRAKHTLAATALTYLILAFGQMAIDGNDTVNQIALHLLMCAAALYFVRHSKLELLR